MTFKVFIPAVHAYSQAIKPHSCQKRKVSQNAYLRKSSCPEIRVRASHNKDEIFRNSSLPNFTTSSREIQPINNTIAENTNKNLRRLQSVEEEKEEK